MDTVNALMMGKMNRGKEMKVFDWNKAAKIIKERGAQEASAGLAEDYSYTGGFILYNGMIIRNSCTYLASTWATPTLYVDSEEIPCYVMESQTNWNEYTRWPESAVKILMGDKYGEY